MNAPINIANLESRSIMLPRGDLIPSPTNPRKRKGLDIASLTDLAQTMRPPVGILQPILVRHLVQDGTIGISFVLANEGKYEIIAGERRWRGSEIAGLNEVPVIVRQLSDIEVLKIQLIENRQREDLDELEEAEGYEKLMQQKDADGKQYTADTIAEAMGVSRSTIYGRLKLLDLCQEARQAFYDGKLDSSRALLIARIPVEKLQIQVLKKAIEFNEFYQRASLSYRQLRDLIQNEYMLDLDKAPFDIKDARLTPKVGSCTDCKERTGNQPDLFDDVDSKDVCTNPVCHAMKKTAHVLALQKAAEEIGNKLLLGKDAKKLIPNYMKTTEEHLQDHGLVTLDSKVPGDDKKRTFGQILKEAKLLTPSKDTGKATVSKTIVEHPHRTNTMIETVSIEQATKALREAGFEITMKNNASPTNIENQRDKVREKEKQDLAIENTFRSRLFDSLHAKIETDMLNPNSDTYQKLYRMLAIQLWHDHDYFDIDDIIPLIRKFVALPNKEEGKDIDWQSHISEFSDNLPNLTPAQHLMLIIELPLITQEITAGHISNKATTMLEMAKELNIDANSLRKEVETQHKATLADAKKAKSKPAAPAPEPAKVRPAATWPFPVAEQPNKSEAEPSSTPPAAAQAQGKAAEKKTKAAPAAKATPKATAVKAKKESR